MESWFWYEFTDGPRTSKASTEDVTNTREIQLASYLKFKEPTPLANLHLSLLDKVGVQVESFGDSNGKIHQLGQPLGI